MQVTGPAYSTRLTHHPMALSTLNASLPPLKDLIALTPRPPSPPKTPPIPKIPPKKTNYRPQLLRDIRRDILLLRKLNDYDNKIEYTYERIAAVLSYRHGRIVTERAVQYSVQYSIQ
jgi:hypothetical protein